MDEKPSKITATVAKATFAELVRRVQFGSERIVIQNHGQDAVAVISIEDFETLGRSKSKEHHTK